MATALRAVIKDIEKMASAPVDPDPEETPDNSF